MAAFAVRQEVVLSPIGSLPLLAIAHLPCLASARFKRELKAMFPHSQTK